MLASRVRLCTLLVLLIVPSVVRAQAPVTVQDLRTPYSPAFVLIGITPSTVERPTNPKALAMSVFGAIQNGGDYALEVAPYWLVSHPTLTFDDYYKASILDVIEQTFSVSAAVAPNLDNPNSGSSSTNGSDTGVGLAARFAMFRGHPRPADLDALAKTGNELADLSVERLKAIARHDDAAVADIESEMNAKVAASDAIRKRVGESGHLGFSWDVAGGAAGKFPSGGSQDGRFTAAGIWTTPGYRTESLFGSNINLEVIGVGRYLRNEDGSDDNLVDVGGRLTAEMLELPFASSLALSFEGVERVVTSSGGPGNTERLAGIIEYELPAFLQLGNAKYITATFGEDFATPNQNNRTIVLLGLNFTFGSDPQLLVPPAGT